MVDFMRAHDSSETRRAATRISADRRRVMVMPGWAARPVIRALHSRRFHLPGWIRKKVLRRMFTMTAEAFGCAVPRLNHLTATALLVRFAQFTRDQAQAALDAESGPASVIGRLEQRSRELGSQLRQILHISSEQDMILVSQLLYAMLGIEMLNISPGKITITRCFFSATYSPDICRVISALDSGLAYGLSGGQRLIFRQRITEGCASCAADLRKDRP